MNTQSFTDEQGLSWDVPQRRQQSADDARVYPRFYIEAVPDPVKSKAEGRPVHRDEERVEIIVAGDKSSVVTKKVTDEHRRRWPQHYAKFREGVEQSPEGVPLEQWPILTRARVLDLKALGILTVEHVAALDDNAINRIGMGGRQLVAQAKAWLDSARGNAATSALAAENATLKAQLAAVAANHADLAGKFDALMAHVGATLPAEVREAVKLAPAKAAPLPAVAPTAAPRMRKRRAGEA